MIADIDGLLQLYENGSLSRRALLGGLAALIVAPGAALAAPVKSSVSPVFQARTINHVTMYSSNVARTKEFYRTLTGLGIRDEGADYCELRVKNGFLGIYALEPGKQLGFDHLCFGVDRYEPKAALAAIQRAFPDAHASIENDDQVYVRDPDGVRVQISDVKYKV